jgi:hypothetical protein
MLYRLLSNPTYVGRIPHNGQSYPGLHAPIIDAEVWDEVQSLLASNKSAREPERIPYKGSALGGLLFDDRGNMMTPSYAKKGKRRRYRYYISQALLQNDPSKAGSLARVPAPLVEHIVGEVVQAELSADTQQRLQWHSNEPRVPLRRCIERVTIGREGIDVLLRYPRPGRVVTRGTFVRQGKGLGFERLDAGRRPGKERPSLPLVKAVCKAFHWRMLLERGEVRSLYGLARQQGMNPGYVRRVMQLAFLCPSVVQAILAGDRLSVRGVVDLTSKKVPLSWAAQRELLLGERSAAMR